VRQVRHIYCAVNTFCRFRECAIYFRTDLYNSFIRTLCLCPWCIPSLDWQINIICYVVIYHISYKFLKTGVVAYKFLSNLLQLVVVTYACLSQTAHFNATNLSTTFLSLHVFPFRMLHFSCANNISYVL